MSTKINPSLNSEAAARLSEYTNLVSVPELPDASIEYKNAAYFLTSDGRFYRCIQNSSGSWMWQAVTSSPEKTEQIDSILQSLIEQGSVGDPALRSEFEAYREQTSAILEGFAKKTKLLELEQRISTLEDGGAAPASNTSKILAAFTKISELEISDEFTVNELKGVVTAIIAAAKDLVSEGIVEEGE